MKIYVAVTDNEWFNYLSSLQYVDEVNFWQPSGRMRFRALLPGEPFLFKLHSPLDYIVGGGFFAHSSVLPFSISWEAFGEKNGAHSIDEMRRRIIKYKRDFKGRFEDFQIGCILLEQPFFFKKKDWIPIPKDWNKNIVRGKSYNLSTDTGRSLWKRITLSLYEMQVLPRPEYQTNEGQARYGKKIQVKPRLGQGSFKIVVTDAYKRSCAVTGERALPVLEAAHIKPYADGGEHRIDNGILLRSDVHRLFDKGYMTITPSLKIEISRRIKEEFDNGKYYYTFHGRPVNKPRYLFDQPSKEFLEWHNENVFRG